MSPGNRLEIVAQVDQGEDRDGPPKPTRWMRIGSAFARGDGSLSLIFDFVPPDLDATTVLIQPA
jgi:hypothetical protein